MTHSSTTPANPAQGVSKLLERSADHVKMAKAIGNFGIASHLVAELSEALTAAIGTGRSPEPEFETAPDNGTPAEVLAYVLDCARRWVPEARIIGNARAGDIERAIAAIGAGGQAITQFRKTGCSDWYDGLPDNEDGRGPYETRTLYSHPAPKHDG